MANAKTNSNSADQNDNEAGTTARGRKARKGASARGGARAKKTQSARKTRRATRSTSSTRNWASDSDRGQNNSWTQDAAIGAWGAPNWANAMQQGMDATILPFTRPFASADAYQASSNARNSARRSADRMTNTMQNQFSQFDRLATDAANSSRESMEAFVQCGTILAKGYEDVMKTCMSFAQEMTERQSEAFKQLLRCKTLNELTEANNRIAQQNFDDIMSNATRLSEMSVRICTEAFEPVNDQISKTIRKASDTMAA